MIKKVLVLVIINLIWTSQISIGAEFNFLFTGRNVDDAYYSFALKTMPIDIIYGMPVLLASFNDEFSESRMPMAHLNPTRACIAKYSENEYIVSPLCIIEFNPKNSTDRLPIEIQDAIAAEYSDIDVSAGLFAGLKAKGAENIFITACCYGPVLSRVGGSKTSELNIILQGFLGFDCTFTKGNSYGQRYFCGNVITGIFEPHGIIPIDIKTNTLARQNLSFHGPGSRYSGDVLKCQLWNIDGCSSFYVVAVTQDKKHVLITLILTVNNAETANEVKDLLCNVTRFVDIPLFFESYGPSLVPDTDREALQHAVRSLVQIVDGKAIVGQISEDAIARQERIVKLRQKRTEEELTLMRLKEIDLRRAQRKMERRMEAERSSVKRVEPPLQPRELTKQERIDLRRAQRRMERRMEAERSSVKRVEPPLQPRELTKQERIDLRRAQRRLTKREQLLNSQENMYGVIGAPKNMELCPEFFTKKVAEYLHTDFSPFDYHKRIIKNPGKIDLFCIFDHKTDSEYYKQFDNYTKFSRCISRHEYQQHIYLLFTADNNIEKSNGHFQLLVYSADRHDWNIITNPTTQYYLNDPNDREMVTNLMRKRCFCIVNIELADLVFMREAIYRARCE